MKPSNGAYIDPRAPESLRLAPRRLVNAPAEIVSSAVGHLQATITDISRLGCRAELFCRFAEGDVLLVNLPDKVLTSGRVIWSTSTAVGLKFISPIATGVLNQLIARFPHTPPPTGAQPLAAWSAPRRTGRA
jgi:hypothetical protein